MQYVSTATPLAIPVEVALCPYCQTPVTAEIMACEQEADGTWTASEITLSCATEPELVTEDANEDAVFEAWLATHADMPYVHMLPVEQRVLVWLEQHYRFTVEGA